MGFLALVACGEDGEIDEDALPAFDPSVVIFADGCAPLPEAQDCVEANPVSFLPGDAAETQAMCIGLGYECCDPATWISLAAAQCIAEQDPRISDFSEKRVDTNCHPDIVGPTFNVYDLDSPDLIGVGVHAATGRLIWFDDGTGTYS